MSSRESSGSPPALDLRQTLNEEQYEAVTHGEGPQLVIAGAGSGKTRVITYRIAWLALDQGVEPYRIAAVTFTNKAASEMRDRVEKLLGGRSEVFVGTFHRFSLRLLRRYGDLVGLDRNFSIFDSDDQMRLMKQVIKDERLDDTTFRPRGVLSRISEAKSNLISVRDFADQASGFYEERIATAYGSYQRLLREASGADFDDLIFHAVRLLDGDSEIGDRMRHRLRYLLVDEFQDTNLAQLRLVQSLVGKGGNLTAVGDEDQGIYRWRGAELSNILEFEDRFPGATVRKLERNYRSTQTILDAAGDLVANNRQRRGKRLWTDAGDGEPLELHRCRDEGEEAQWIARRARALHGEVPFRDMAVLVRTNAQTRAIEDELLRRKIPYCLIAGVRFYDRAEVKDVVAYLRVVRNPDDNVSLRRILNQPPRGIGKATQQAIFREAEDLGHSTWDVIRFDRFGGIGARGANALRGFRDLIEELREEGKTCNLPELAQRVVERTGLLAQHSKDDPESQTRLDNLRELLSAAGEFAEDFGRLDMPAFAGLPAEPDQLLDDAELEVAEDPLTAFLDYVALVSDTDALENDVGVSLMTLHSAKGLEFPVVFLPGLEDGLLPHFNSETPDEMEEERRLLYVGMTRAEKRLLLSTCLRRRVAGRYQDQDESPFLEEIPEALVQANRPSWNSVDSTSRAVFSFFGSESQASRRPAPGVEQTPPPSAESAPPFDPFESEPTIPVSSPTANRTRSTSRSASKPPAYDPTLPMRKGVGVRHPKLGKGVILEVSGEGELAKLTVYFDRAGKRKLIAKYAGLEALE
ncbi:MAG: UvrD-helicase domain-containing protein [Acidobacteriota bacterium]